MGKKKGVLPTKRALERRALQELYRSATLPGLMNLLDMRKLDLKELRKYYTDARSIAKKAVERIQRGMFPFTDEGPTFKKTSELSDEELLRAVADVNLFLRSPTTSQKGRREAYEALLQDLHNKGMTYLRLEDLTYWDRFRKWLSASHILGKPYASGDVLGDIFAQSVQDAQPNSEKWQELWDQFSTLTKGRRGRIRQPKARAGYRRGPGKRE